MSEFSSTEEITKVEVKHPSRFPASGAEVSVGSVSNFVGDLEPTAIQPAPDKPVQGEFIDVVNPGDYEWDGLIPTPFPVYHDAKCKCTAELTKKICQTIIAGNFPDSASIKHGISRMTYRNWLTRGQQGEEPFAAFVASIDRAKATAETKLLDTVSRGDPQGVGFGPAKAGLEILRGLEPKRWSQQVRIEVQDQLTKVLHAVEVEADPDTFRRILGRLAALELE